MTKPRSPRHHAVVVNEPTAFTDHNRVEWWALFRQRMHKDRCVVIQANLDGDLVSVRCENNQEAEKLADMMRAMGMPPSALTVHRPHPHR